MTKKTTNIFIIVGTVDDAVNMADKLHVEDDIESTATKPTLVANKPARKRRGACSPAENLLRMVRQKHREGFGHVTLKDAKIFMAELGYLSKTAANSAIYLLKVNGYVEYEDMKVVLTHKGLNTPRFQNTQRVSKPVYV